MTLFIGCLTLIGALSLCAPGLAFAMDVKPIEVAPNMYALIGAQGEASVDNRARTGNVAFIVGPAGVVVVETGVSYRHGEDIIAAIAKVTDRPIRLAIITHPAQEFLFGAAAFQARGIPVWMHREAAELMAVRCETCRSNLTRLLGDAEMAGTRIVTPDRLLERDETVALTGRRLRVLALGHSNAPGALAVIDDETGTLIAGDEVSIERVPDVRDADLPSWGRNLERLAALNCRHLIPGGGRIGDCGDIAALQSYLARLENRVAALLKAGVGLGELPERIVLPEFQQWDRYAPLHAANASRIYLRLENNAFK